MKKRAKEFSEDVVMVAEALSVTEIEALVSGVTPLLEQEATKPDLERARYTTLPGFFFFCSLCFTIDLAFLATCQFPI